MTLVKQTCASSQSNTWKVWWPHCLVRLSSNILLNSKV